MKKEEKTLGERLDDLPDDVASVVTDHIKAWALCPGGSFDDRERERL